MEGMSSEPITLPAAPAEPSRPPVPFVAAVVPIAAGVVLWLVTGSVLALCFALLGPLMIAGSLLDGVRQRRRESRRRSAEADAAWARVDEEIDERRGQESEALWRRHPDVAHCLAAERLHEDSEVDAATPLVVGSGERPSALRLNGGEGERARMRRQRARMLKNAPIVVLLGRGVCIRAPRVVGEAIARALVAQLCLRFLPARLALVGHAGVGFAHARAVPRGALRLGVGRGASEPVTADATIWVCDPGDAVPEGITTVIDCSSPAEATLLTAEGTQPITAECLSAAQFDAIAQESARRAAGEAGLPERVLLEELAQPPHDGSLRVAIGRGAEGDAVVDLVSDGPHAMVIGMTGSGKSELLVSWVTAIAAAHGPDEVIFVLADFKGGTAFDPLRGFPHVTAVLTDLDEDGARRGVQSLTAELRRRERVLAAAGVRDIASPGVRMPRLVIVVDEFAALLQEHPDLAAVFTDVAARGRALGMHLILGTQRAAGVIRDALAANCPLRISLRVADPADSRMVIGSADAAELEGGPRSRGVAFLRRPQDVEASAVRVALTGPEELRVVGVRWGDAVRPAGPWLPPLPATLPLEELERPADGSLVLGLADEPEMQRQTTVTLRPGRDRGVSVIGGPGSGKSTVLRVLAHGRPQTLMIPADPEGAWDVVTALAVRGARGDLVLCDDVDRLLAAFPHDYALAFADRLEQFLRGAEGCTTVLTAGRTAGATARVMEALPERMLLRLPSRAEHLAAGGESASFQRDRLPGRGHLAGSEVQVAWVAAGGGEDADVRSERWRPGRRLVGVIGNGTARLLDAFRVALPDWEVTVVGSRPGPGPGPGPGSVPVPEGATSAWAGSTGPGPRGAETPGAAPARPGSIAEGAAAPARNAAGTIAPGNGAAGGGTDDAGGTMLIGEGESWQRDWAGLQRVRSEGEMLVLAECATELRTLLGVRELPPYARPHAGRAWLVRDGRPPERVVLPVPQRGG